MYNMRWSVDISDIILKNTSNGALLIDDHVKKKTGLYVFVFVKIIKFTYNGRKISKNMLISCESFEFYWNVMMGRNKLKLIHIYFSGHSHKMTSGNTDFDSVFFFYEE